MHQSVWLAIWLALLLSWPSLVRAQQVYKCSDGRHVAYQSHPCEGSQRTIRQWDATPEPVATKPQAGEPNAKRAPASSRSPRPKTSGRRNATTDYDRRVTRCETAKARRDAKLKSVGLKRNFDLLRKLDDAVYEACQ